DQRAGLLRVVDRFTPVADDVDAVLDTADLVPVLEAADVGARAFVHRDDAQRGRRVQRCRAGLASLLDGQQAAGDGTHAVMSVAAQRLLGGVSGGVGQVGGEPAQCAGRGRGVDVDAGQVGGPVADGGVEVIGAG